MGKVVKIAAGAVGIAAMLIPGVGQFIGGQIFGALGGLAGGTIGSVALGVSQVVRAGLFMAGSPVADMEPIHIDGPLAVLGGGGLLQLAARNEPVEAMLPIRRWWHFPRFRFARMTGDCMMPHVRNGAHMLLDRAVAIRGGDLIALRTEAGLIAKRFVKFDREGLVLETTNPMPQRYWIPIEKLNWVYRVRAIGATRRELVQAYVSIRESEDAHTEKLAADLPHGVRRVA